jgi:hypothetical protein
MARTGAAITMVDDGEKFGVCRHLRPVCRQGGRPSSIGSCHALARFATLADVVERIPASGRV